MRFHQKYLLIVMCGIAFQLNAEEQGDSLVWEGVYAFYNNETALANKILTQARGEYPLNAAVHFTWVAARWLHSQANDPIKKTYKVLNRDLDVVIPLYEDLIEQYPENPLYKLYLGSAEGLRARVYLGQKKWLSTLFPAYHGFKISKHVADNYPEIKDAMLPIGVVEYFAALRSALLRWTASLFGLETTKESGLAKMEIAAREGEWTWIEARSLLTFIYLWEAPDDQLALEHSSVLAKEFPKNFYFVLMHTESLIKAERFDEALLQLNQLEQDFPDLTPMQKNHLKSYHDYEWALYWFEHQEYDKAKGRLHSGVRDYTAELDIYLGNSWLLLGQIYDLEGDRWQAEKAYHKCVDLDNNGISVEYAEKYLEKPYRK